MHRTISKRLDTFLEYVGDYPAQGTIVQILHAGTVYSITPLNKLDLSLGVGLNRHTPSLFVSAGYTFRLDHLFH